MKAHTFCHLEWAVSNLEKAKAFYSGLFNWKFQDWGEEYSLISTPSEEFGGGLMKTDKIEAGFSPTVYIHVESVQNHLDKAASLGAKICVPKTEIPTHGWFGIFTDPDGNTVGLFESSKEDVRTPYHSFCHVEWSVRDGEKAREFFGGLFNWQFREVSESYLGFMTPSDDVGGGLMVEKEVKPGQSPCVYVLVDKIEPYLDKAKELGGNVATPKTEIPDMGWFAILHDHDKNPVGLFESARKE